MYTLRGLQGVKGDIENVEFFSSVSAGIRGLKKARARTTAGDRGSINLWVNDAGLYRGERHAFKRTISSIETKTSRELEAWLKEELPKIY